MTSRTIRELLLIELGRDMSTMTSTQLAKAVGYSSATVSSLLKKMHNDALLYLSAGFGPRGGVGYRLSPWGRLAFVGLRFQQGFANMAKAFVDAFEGTRQ